MKPLFVIILLTLTGGIQECEHNAIQHKMANFDRALIPLWVHLQDQDIYHAKRAVFSTAFQWQQMKKHLQTAYPERADWAPTFDSVEAWLGDCYYAVDANCADLAINQLQHVRYELSNLRNRYKIPYYFDQLYAFEDQLAIVLEVTDDVMLCLFEWQELEILVKDLNITWGELKQFPLNGEVYGLSDKEVQNINLLEEEVEQQLHYFNQELACANREEVAVATLYVKRNFEQLQKVFGNFNANQTFLAGQLNN